ncbi:hypothetical protein ACFFX0_14775 [Citricoccus parietis]|uniref:Uncharacterized protein n=1 Tax=Citricoccus parietis TaxID=592307 RepID=A0ABV5G0C3_9MICC
MASALLEAPAISPRTTARTRDSAEPMTVSWMVTHSPWARNGQASAVAWRLSCTDYQPSSPAHSCSVVRSSGGRFSAVKP